jgi:CheY-like chemotaxis protein
VLLVEDNADAQEALSDLLTEFGYQVETVASGAEGVRRALTDRHQVALIDIGLPEMDGYEVARQIRASPGGDQIFLIAFTGYGGNPERQEAFDAGFDHYLVKPVEQDKLMKILDGSFAVTLTALRRQRALASAGGSEQADGLEGDE